ncbi:hypothetical protein KUM39_06375 [Streptomyces sp. J2-1]|uniref:hypothetical protein n=1 Tax=Streptomyces corallincola TaxID=2851888 RepID=UPI001C381433|nr:hypothetical protein [Streptomyces corallincola]MBV2353990.1 hypothetical protein [Streptomyces corallincola]
MPWWGFIPLISMVTGPAALYVLARRKRRDDQDERDSVDRERYDELSRKYTELLEDTRRGELPEGREGRTGDR